MLDYEDTRGPHAYDLVATLSLVGEFLDHLTWGFAANCRGTTKSLAGATLTRPGQSPRNAPHRQLAPDVDVYLPIPLSGMV